MGSLGNTGTAWRIPASRIVAHGTAGRGARTTHNEIRIHFYAPFGVILSEHVPAVLENTAPPSTLWARMKTDPQYAPEHLALEAVRRLGPEAERWIARIRAERPGAGPDELAALAVKRFTTVAGVSGAVSGVAGLPGAVLDVGVLAWTQARMVLHVAAAYGADPVAPERATELLVLQRVHKLAETARTALGVAAGREHASRIFTGASGAPMARVLITLGVRLARMAGVRTAKRVAVKVIPLGGVILGTWANSVATRDLARRARDHYRRDNG